MKTLGQWNWNNERNKNMEKLTKKQMEILLNLLLAEQNNINKQNGNIKSLLNDYRVELFSIYQIICDSCYED